MTLAIGFEAAALVARLVHAPAGSGILDEAVWAALGGRVENMRMIGTDIPYRRWFDADGVLWHNHDFTRRIDDATYILPTELGFTVLVPRAGRGVVIARLHSAEFEWSSWHKTSIPLALCGAIVLHKHSPDKTFGAEAIPECLT